MQRRHAQPPVSGRRRAVLAVVAAVLVLLAGLAHPAAAADPGRDRQWALDVIGADAAHVTGRGAGVVIAVIDSGVDLDHEDLAGRLVDGRDFIDGDDRPQDEFGHGTHVAGIAAAVGNNGRGVVGTAPAASIMPVRVLDEDGTGSSQGVSDGIRWAADNGADVINLSLGETTQGIFGSSLTEAVRYAWDRGAVVVVAAGNDFVLSSGFGDEPALVVSATTRDDTKPDYSNGVGGARWGMAAPGGGCQLLTCPVEDDVFSTYWVDGEDDQYAYLRGTSMAAPHVAGAAAVLRGLGLDARATVDRLLATAADIGASGRDSTFGAGRLDLAAAVDGIGSAPAPSEEPSSDPAPSTPAPGATSSPAAEPTTAPSPSAQGPAPGADDPPAAGAQGATSPGSSTAASPTPSPSPTAAAGSPAPSPDESAAEASPAPTVTDTPVGEEQAAGPAPGGDTAGAVPPLLAVTAAVLLAGSAGAVGAAWYARRRLPA